MNNIVYKIESVLHGVLTLSLGFFLLVGFGFCALVFTEKVLSPLFLRLRKLLKNILRGSQTRTETNNQPFLVTRKKRPEEQ